MELYGQYSKSIPQKVAIHALELALLALAYWILFKSGGDWIAGALGFVNSALPGRRIIIFAFNIVIFLRLGYMMVALLNRKIPWEEAISIPFAFAVYYIGFSLLVLPSPQPLNALDVFAVLIFISGCVLNTGSEIQRKQWKVRAENKGMLYTGGLFRWSRHINYFGDVLWVSAYAMVTRNPWAWSIPSLLLVFFAFFNAPKLDRYLKEKYGSQYDDYARKTKMLIPGVY